MTKFAEVAKAIWTTEHGFDGGIAQARAAILAMREPGHQVIFKIDQAMQLGKSPTDVWMAGIDAILADEPAEVGK